MRIDLNTLVVSPISVSQVGPRTRGRSGPAFFFLCASFAALAFFSRSRTFFLAAESDSMMSKSESPSTCILISSSSPWPGR